MEFQNAEINFADLPKFEAVKLQPISRKYGWVVVFNWFVFSIIFLAALLLFNIFKPNFFGVYFKYVLLVSVLFLIINYVIGYFGFFKRKFALRTHDIIYQHGLIKSTTIIIPYNRIQHVNLEEGWLSRVLYIKTIALFTAGQENGDVKIHGLDKKLSEKINQHILLKMKSGSDKPERLETPQNISYES
ncbi:PH domain-containing protein [Kaistella polysaccharea]|uniref:PH domain-containing protein n=1 Tax=Kaistella polysaccharea TaxID=2878534 RepID=UPI001CF1E566|nr:PH domain-containing protein [Kaistella polysaccharea]